jgi:hypothetical protein
MPSISDVANDIIARLDSINGHTAATETSTAQIHSDTEDIRNTAHEIRFELAVLNNNVVAGFGALVQLGLANLNRLDHMIEQNDAIICNLAATNTLLCRQLQHLRAIENMEAREVALLAHIDAINELVHGNEAIEVQRRDELKHQLERCCPPPKQEPEPCPEPCPVPRFDPRKPDLSDFKPETLRVPSNHGAGSIG